MGLMWRDGKKKVSITIIAMMLMALLPTMALAATPSDISSHWAKAYVEDWIDQGLVNGYPDGTFKPDNKITRAEFMVLVNGAFGYTAESDKLYSDVSADDWYADAVAIATNAGYIGGYPDGTVKPNNPISRQEVAVVIMKVNNLTENVGATEKFADAAGIPAWSKGAIGAAVYAGIVSGYPDGTFKAADSITRAEAVVALSRAKGDVVTPADEVTIYDKVGTYGPETGTETLDGDAIIKISGVVLENTVITGDLTIDKAVGSGNATFKNVTVNGDTYINGGGANSVTFTDCTINKAYVLKDSGAVRVVVSGSTVIAELIVQSSARVQEVSLSGKGVSDIVADKKVSGNIELNITGATVDSLTVNSEGVTIVTDKNTTIGTFTANAKLKLTGAGVIDNAFINADGVRLEKKPKSMTVSKGVTQPILSGVTGGGGGGGGVAPPPAKSIALDLTDTASGIGKVAKVTLTGYEGITQYRLLKPDGTPLTDKVDIGDTVVVLLFKSGDTAKVELYKADGTIAEVITVVADSGAVKPPTPPTGSVAINLSDTASGIGKVATVVITGYKGATQYRLLKTDGTPLTDKVNIGNTVVVLLFKSGDTAKVELYGADGAVLDTVTVVAKDTPVGPPPTGTVALSLTDTASGIGKVATVTVTGYEGATQYRLLKTDGTPLTDKVDIGNTVVVLLFKSGDTAKVELLKADGTVLDTVTVVADAEAAEPPTGTVGLSLTDTASGIGKVATVAITGYEGATQYRLLKTDGTPLTDKVDVGNTVVVLLFKVGDSAKVELLKADGTVLVTVPVTAVAG